MVFPPELPEYMGAGFTTSFIMMGCRLLPDMILIPVGMAAVCVCSSYTYIHIALHYLSLATYPLKRAVHDERRYRSTMRQIVLPPLLYILDYKLNGGQKKKATV